MGGLNSSPLLRAMLAHRRQRCPQVSKKSWNLKVIFPEDSDIDIDPENWPPRSPYEAAMTSPGGRRKLQQRANRISPSPSPLKRTAATTSLNRARKASPNAPEEDEDDLEEDEETLQLRLQAIEAKLKLKKLQSRKAKESGHLSENDEPNKRMATEASSVVSSRREYRKDGVIAKSKSAEDVQIPLSPDKRKQTTAQEPRSPGRVLLGIDKGLRGRNISLRRAPNLRGSDDPFSGNSVHAGATPGGTLSRHLSIGRNSGKEVGKSFNERIAESRVREKEEAYRKERIEKLKSQRSTGFGVKESEIENFKKNPQEQTEQQKLRPQRAAEQGFTRDEVLKAVNKSSGGLVRRSNTIGGQRSSRADGLSTASDLSIRPRSSASDRVNPDRPSSQASSAYSSNVDSSSAPVGDPSLFEPYSSSNLSRRILPHSFLKRTLAEKTPVLIPRLLTEVKAPAFELPEELETGDLVVLATIATKSPPLDHKQRPQNQNGPEKTSHEKANETIENENGKYMVLTLTDLKWTLDLFLFNTAYTRWSKLTPGTVVAILNPNVMPPPKHKLDTGRWSLNLNSSEDTVLEIGTNKDLGWCKSIKKDGQQCSDWIDKRKTDYCEFHVDAGVERIRRGRIETQGMGMGFAPGGKNSGRHGFFGAGRRGGGRGGGEWSNDMAGRREGSLKKEGRQYDRGAHSTYFITPNVTGRSAASLLDADEDGDRGSKRDKVRKALAEKEKEREIARKLGSIGGGAGAEYMRGGKEKENIRQESDVAATSTAELEPAKAEPLNAGALGLKANRAEDVNLGSLKRKRSETPGGAKKKTRFVTSKGIREAGRDSLPGPTEIDLDDGLDII